MIFCTHLFKREVLRGFLQLYSYLFAISDIQFARYFFSKLVKALLRFRTCVILGVLTIFVGKPEILVGKSNGSRHSVWEASENMGCDFRRCNFSTLLRLFS